MQSKRTGFTPEQILKGMECCRDAVTGDCDDCPYIVRTGALDVESCVDTMMDDARELIIRLLQSKGEAHG